MQIIEKPKTTRKFSQSCATKQDFIDLLVELRDKAEKKQYDPEKETNFGFNFNKDYQTGFADGEADVLGFLICELAKSPDTRTY
ncbi:hypothetical protein EBQ81_00115 [bacterium]|nr:hypothetical protein [bacterium]NDC96522.1 hypothetical protein [bacterium]